MTSAGGRTCVAALVSPAVIPTVMGGYSLVKGFEAGESLAIAAVYAAFTYGGTLLLGLPAHALLVRSDLTSPWSYVAAGVLLGILILGGFFVMNRNIAVGVISVSIFAIAGALTASAFWAISKPHRP